MNINPPINPPENFPAAWASAWGEDSYGFWQAFEIKGVQQIMRWIPEGEFKMGSPEDEAGRIAEEEKQHDVVIKNGFWLADTVCTQALWQVVMGKNPSDFDDNEENPVESISWNDCQDFILKANHLLGLNFLRLPKEAEWEYSCRAGTSTPFNTGETITTKQANFNGNYPYETEKAKVEKEGYLEKTVPVVSFDPNDWGLFQMHGNVWEWCEDVYSKDYSVLDATDDSLRVLRGGSWFYGARYLRSAFRVAGEPDNRSPDFSVRLAGGLDPTSTQVVGEVTNPNMAMIVQTSNIEGAKKMVCWGSRCSPTTYASGAKPVRRQSTMAV